MRVKCVACEAEHEAVGRIDDLFVIECANVSATPGVMWLLDTRLFVNGEERMFVGYDGYLWVRYAR